MMAIEPISALSRMEGQLDIAAEIAQPDGEMLLSSAQALRGTSNFRARWRRSRPRPLTLDGYYVRPNKAIRDRA